ncbi:MAG: hypothetical protein QXP53_01410 [Candidatus Pacearchaeota archaeon]
MLEKKQKIVEIISQKGPSLPGNLSGEIKLSLLFTSALLSEMVADKTLKFSHLKVGGSPLYFLPGQEEQVENFVNYLPVQEKEVFKLLKEKKVLEDEKLTPVQRVALRNIKDFAIMIKQPCNGREKIFWRLHSFPEEEAIKEIKTIIEKLEETKKVEEEIRVQEIQVPKEPKIEETKGEKLERAEEKKEKKIRKKKQDAFREKVLEHLTKKKIEIFREMKEENKICIALVDSEIGFLKFLVYGLNKKTINEADLSLALSCGQEEKLPVLLATQGKLTKKASEYLKKFGNITIYKI